MIPRPTALTRHTRALTARCAGPDRDAGVVMITVVLTMVLITSLVTAGLAYAMSSQKASRGDQDRAAALAAAQAGVDDYLARLNRNDNYGRLNPFDDCANTALQGPRAPANSCGWTASTAPGWQPVVPGSGPLAPAYHYDVETGALDSTGTVKITSTGQANGRKRTLQVTLGRKGSQDYLYYTDHEDADPDNDQAYPTPMPARCASYWWGTSPDGYQQARKNAGTGCLEIRFAGGDVLDGKVHVNDTPLTATRSDGVKPSFPQGLETSDPACKAVVRTDPSTYKLCDRTGNGADYGSSAPVYGPPQYLEDNTAKFAGYPGCTYTGATRIKFLDTGRMTVWSKESTGLSPACGGAQVATGATVDVPTDKVIYVKAGSTVRLCKSKEIDGILPLGTYKGPGASGTSYTIDRNMTYAEQRCGQGNVYVEGKLKGRVTIAAQHSIVLTGDTTYAGGLNGTDLLGLVAGNSVSVFHPVMITCTQQANAAPSTRCDSGYARQDGFSEVAGWPSGATVGGIEVDAAIQTLTHSFYVQSYDRGQSQGTLRVRGAIAQKWRGFVGTDSGATGYLKDYRYDKRLTYSAPPYFPQFVGAEWSTRYVGEISNRY